jgi:DinB family protein
MHPRLDELVDYAGAQRAVLLSALALIPEALRDRPAGPDTWSAAEVLEHLHRVERGIARLLVYGRGRAEAEGIGEERDDSSVMACMDQFHLIRRGPRISAPEQVRPRGEYSAARALVALAESRQALLSAVEAVDGLALGEIVHSHPWLGELNLYQWVLFLGQHEARHAAQIQEIAAQLTESRS